MTKTEDEETTQTIGENFFKILPQILKRMNSAEGSQEITFIREGFNIFSGPCFEDSLLNMFKGKIKLEVTLKSKFASICGRTV